MAHDPGQQTAGDGRRHDVSPDDGEDIGDGPFGDLAPRIEEQRLVDGAVTGATLLHDVFGIRQRLHARKGGGFVPAHIGEVAAEGALRPRRGIRVASQRDDAVALGDRELEGRIVRCAESGACAENHRLQIGATRLDAEVSQRLTQTRQMVVQQQGRAAGYRDGLEGPHAEEESVIRIHTRPGTRADHALTHRSAPPFPSRTAINQAISHEDGRCAADTPSVRRFRASRPDRCAISGFRVTLVRLFARAWRPLHPEPRGHVDSGRPCPTWQTENPHT